MREIKFTVWDYDTNTMYHKDDLIITFDKVGEDVYVYKNETVEPLYNYKILQYAGLKDKNGKEICEGDIIETKDFYECGELVFKGKIQEVKSLEYYINGCTFIDTLGEVIGNIYENKDLLEGIE